MERHEDAVFALSKLNLDDIEKTIHEAYHQEGPGRPPRSARANAMVKLYRLTTDERMPSGMLQRS